MNKQQLLDEIRRVAAASGGKPPGRLAFEAEAGVKEHEWRGRYWAKWSDAIREAGLEPNQKSVAYGEAHLIEQLIGLIRKIEHFPTSSELKLEATNNSDFPSEMAFRRLGGKQQLVTRTLTHITNLPGYEDVSALCAAVAADFLLQKIAKRSTKVRLALSTS